MQRLITLGFTVDLLADFASIMTDSGTILATSLALSMLSAGAAIWKFVLGADSNIAEFRVEPIRR